MNNYPCGASNNQRRPIICDINCESCGFNPAEAERRMREGHFETTLITRCLHDDNGNVVNSVTNTCRKLVFPSAS